MLLELRIRPGDFRFRSVMRAVRANNFVHHGKVSKVPHLSLYGNVTVPYGKWPELRKRVAEVCEKYHTLPYLVDNYASKAGHEGNVIAFQITPSPELLSFRNELVRSLSKDFPSEKPYDSEHVNPWFHITIAHELSDSESEQVWAYLNEGDPQRERGLEQPHHVRKVRPYLPLEGLRVTILNNRGRIDREYDLAQERFLTRNEALDWQEWCRTYRSFRVKSGIELRRSGLLKQLVRRTRKPEQYFISDLHLDHGNIVQYGARPFCRDVREMNRVLVNNWNYSVRNTDRVYFLGDLTFGRDRKPSSYWWHRLKGEKLFVKGNHDDNSVASIPYNKFSVRDVKEKETKSFAVVHNPDEMQDELRRWVEANQAWVIHGDKHNNNVRYYPFINGETKTINASVEVIDYRPVALGFLLSLRLNDIRRMDTIRSEPIRW